MRYSSGRDSRAYCHFQSAGSSESDHQVVPLPDGAGPAAHAGVHGCFEPHEHLKPGLILTLPACTHKT
jgi:hypothetical protein